MLDNYLIIHKDILPDYYAKILNAKHMLAEGKAKDVSQAVKLAGISRSTFYKYKDYIFEPSDIYENRKAVLNVILNHEPGVLSAVLACISDAKGSVLTISQSIPIHNVATVTITIEIDSLEISLPQLLATIEATSGVENAKLIAVE